MAIAAAFSHELLEYIRASDASEDKAVKDILSQGSVIQAELGSRFLIVAVLDAESTTGDNVVKMKSRWDSDEDIEILGGLNPIDYAAERSDRPCLQIAGRGGVMAAGLM